MGVLSSKPARPHLLRPCMDGDLAEAKRLVGRCISDGLDAKSFADAADPAGNGTAVHGAVFGGHLEVLRFLAETCKADVGLANGLGCTPLWVAAGYGRTECLDYLVDWLEMEGRLRAELVRANGSGDSPFLAAAHGGHLEACRRLLSAAERAAGESDDDAVKARMLRGANKRGDTPLCVAVAAGHGEEMVKFLLEEDGVLPAEGIVDSSSGNGDLSQRSVNRKQSTGLSPVTIAAERDAPDTLRLLLDHGGDINITDGKGRNALSLASFCGHVDTLNYLLGLEAGRGLLDARDDKGCTPLWLAARTGNVKIVRILLEAGADPTIGDDEGTTPAGVAEKFDKKEVLDCLTSHEVMGGGEIGT